MHERAVLAGGADRQPVRHRSQQQIPTGRASSTVAHGLDRTLDAEAPRGPERLYSRCSTRHGRRDRAFARVHRAGPGRPRAHPPALALVRAGHPYGARQRPAVRQDHGARLRGRGSRRRTAADPADRLPAALAERRSSPADLSEDPGRQRCAQLRARRQRHGARVDQPRATGRLPRSSQPAQVAALGQSSGRSQRPLLRRGAAGTTRPGGSCSRRRTGRCSRASRACASGCRG